MNYWLVKSEPSTWSWDDQLAARSKRTEWDGVRNAQATIHLKAMQKGDQAFFYHSGGERRIVGVVEIVREHRPDPTDDSGRGVMVAVQSIESLPKPVSLAQIKSHPQLKHLMLVRNSRLSVLPIDPDSWKIIQGLGGI